MTPHVHLGKGIKVVAWFEYGFMSAAVISGAVATNGFHEHAKKQGWVTDARQFMGHNWMDISKPAVADFIGSIMADAAKMPDLAGVQVDDHVGCPLSPCTPAISLAAIKTLVSKVKAANAAILFSYAPPTLSFAIDKIRSPYNQWLDNFGEIAPQIYRPTAAATKALLDEHLRFIPKSKFVAGLRASGNPPTPFAEVAKMVKAVKTAGIKGFSVWDYNTIGRNTADWPKALA